MNNLPETLRRIDLAYNAMKVRLETKEIECESMAAEIADLKKLLEQILDEHPVRPATLSKIRKVLKP